MARAKEVDERLVARVARDLGLEAPRPPAPAAAGVRPGERSRIDLAEIDRYLESLK